MYLEYVSHREKAGGGQGAPRKCTRQTTSRPKTRRRRSVIASAPGVGTSGSQRAGGREVDGSSSSDKTKHTERLSAHAEVILKTNSN